jgi:hypothetical protein
MCTCEGFEPGARRLITDLDDLGQGDRTVFCGEVFDGRRVVVVLPIQILLKMRDDILDI